jgi:hypothetical protein
MDLSLHNEGFGQCHMVCLAELGCRAGGYGISKWRWGLLWLRGSHDGHNWKGATYYMIALPDWSSRQPSYDVVEGQKGWYLSLGTTRTPVRKSYHVVGGTLRSKGMTLVARNDENSSQEELSCSRWHPSNYGKWHNSDKCHPFWPSTTSDQDSLVDDGMLLCLIMNTRFVQCAWSGSRGHRCGSSR